MVTELDPTAVMAAHAYHGEGSEVECAWEDWAHKEGHCLPYRLAEALAVERARVARVQRLRPGLRGVAGPAIYWFEVEDALADRFEQTS